MAWQQPTNPRVLGGEIEVAVLDLEIVHPSEAKTSFNIEIHHPQVISPVQQIFSLPVALHTLLPYNVAYRQSQKPTKYGFLLPKTYT